MFDKMPPHNRAAEKALLGGLLRDPMVLPDVQAALGVDDFYFDAHQKLYTAICDLAGKSCPIEPASVFEELRSRNQAEDIGGASYLADLWESAATGANSLYYAKLIRDASSVRQLIHAASEVLRDAYDNAGPADEMIAAAERKILAIADAKCQGEQVKNVRQLFQEAMGRIDSNSGGLGGKSTGYPMLDNVTGGLKDGELTIIGARPSVGKTALGLNIAINAAMSGTPVLFFSLEMPESQIAERMLSMGSGVPMHKFTRGRNLNDTEVSRLIETSSPDGLGGCGIWVESTSDQPAARIAAITRRAIRKYGIQIVVVDYLQLIRAENAKDNKAQQVGTLALRMKQLARDCGIPVLVPSQLNRDTEHRGKPRLSDLKESGDIEAHADRVILLHREHDLPQDHEIWPIDVIVAKNRNGPVGSVTMSYRRPVMRFEERPAGW